MVFSESLGEAETGDACAKDEDGFGVAVGVAVGVAIGVAIGVAVGVRRVHSGSCTSIMEK